MIVADAGYSQNTAFRQALSDRGLDYMVAVRADESAPSARGSHPARLERKGPQTGRPLPAPA